MLLVIYELAAGIGVVFTGIWISVESVDTLGVVLVCHTVCNIEFVVFLDIVVVHFHGFTVFVIHKTITQLGELIYVVAIGFCNNIIFVFFAVLEL